MNDRETGISPVNWTDTEVKEVDILPKDYQKRKICTPITLLVYSIKTFSLISSRVVCYLRFTINIIKTSRNLGGTEDGVIQLNSLECSLDVQRKTSMSHSPSPVVV